MTEFFNPPKGTESSSSPGNSREMELPMAAGTRDNLLKTLDTKFDQGGEYESFDPADGEHDSLEITWRPSDDELKTTSLAGPNTIGQVELTRPSQNGITERETYYFTQADDDQVNVERRVSMLMDSELDEESNDKSDKLAVARRATDQAAFDQERASGLTAVSETKAQELLSLIQTAQ
ncbi:MAG TPA: hypothetical protein VLI05_04820 [Candidatus Saccharimonadia bacterium]|nr:hypothetical protein [Candidatus Saccharimonadia bacterium]